MATNSTVFVPREVAPTADEKWWKTSENPCIPIYNGTVLPNCVGYAHGRFCEILGYFHPDLPACDAGKWLDVLKSKSTKLTWGSTPKLGAVAVWKKSGKAGHVAIVEYINDDGTIMLSESGYGCAWNYRFWTEGPRCGPNWYKTNDYEFQGFIYNPGTENVTKVVPWKKGTPWGTAITDDVKYSTDITTTVTEVKTSSVPALTKTTSSISATSTAVNTSTVSTTSETQITKTEATALVDVSENSAVKEHPAKLFIRSLVSHMGEKDHDWVLDSTSISNTQGWSTATICAAAKYCKFGIKIIPTDICAATSFCKSLVQDLGGIYIPSTTGTPQVGDIFAVLSQKVNTSDKWLADRLGVVRDVQADVILTIEGDLNGKIQLYRRRSKDVRYFVRPNWTKLGADTSVDSTQSSFLYTNRSTNADATLREVAYLNKQYEPSITLSDIKLSAINYTPLLSDIYSTTLDYLLNAGYSVENMNSTHASYEKDGVETYVDYSVLETENAKIIFKYFLDTGFTSSIACGWLSNIKLDSNYRPDSVRDSACGLLNNIGARKSTMISMCPDWKTNVTGQLDHLLYELKYNDKNTSALLANVVGDDLESAKQAAEIIAKNYEGKSASDIQKAKNSCSNIWSELILSTNFSGKSDVVTQSEEHIVTGEAISIPSGIHQYEISTLHKVYIQIYSTWSASSKQKKIADAWKSRGQTYMYRIACLDGYFLVCLTPVFGNVGDIVSVVLDDGSYFNAIVADVDPSTGNTWGFNSSSGVDIIKWMSAPIQYSNNELLQGLVQSGWFGRKVIKIVNYGSWLDR